MNIYYICNIFLGWLFLQICILLFIFRINLIRLRSDIVWFWIHMYLKNLSILELRHNVWRPHHKSHLPLSFGKKNFDDVVVWKMVPYYTGSTIEKLRAWMRKFRHLWRYFILYNKCWIRLGHIYNVDRPNSKIIKITYKNKLLLGYELQKIFLS